MTTKTQGKRGPKEKASTHLLLGLKQGETFPRVKIFDLDEGPVDINVEKSKLARSMESRMTQLRRKHESFQNTKFTNQSFTSLLSDNHIVCGTVLTCVVGEEPQEDADALDYTSYVLQIRELSIGDSMPIVNVVSTADSTIDLDSEKAFVCQIAERSIAMASEIAGLENAQYMTESFTTMLANGNIVFGTIIKRTA